MSDDMESIVTEVAAQVAEELRITPAAVKLAWADTLYGQMKDAAIRAIIAHETQRQAKEKANFG